MIKGIGVSSGIGIGPVLILKKQEIKVPNTLVEDSKAEIKKFDDALSQVINETNDLYEKTLQEIGAEEAAIFEAHKSILEDEFSLVNPIKERIENDKMNAALAVETQLNEIISMFQNMDDDYMRERAADAKDIKTRLINRILGVEETDLSKLDKKYIIVAEDLTPSNTAKMDAKNVSGIVTQIGGRTSHTAILARILEIPAVVGASEITKACSNEDTILLDGETGEIFINPDKELVEKYQIRMEEIAQEKKQLQEFFAKPSLTLDGHKVELAANIGTPEDSERALECDAEAIGLFRSEFLYMDRDGLPNEEEQFEAYKKVLVTMNPKPVIIRTLDIGGDKDLPALNMPKEENPFLGYRAIRLCLDRVDVFKVQLRALMRASYYGKLRIMFPMISNINELRAAKGLIEEVKAELKNEGLPYDENVEVGIMIEIPATAVMADIFAKECDFFSIGTNDLIQYTVAVDRGNEKIAHLYSPFNPAVLRLIKMAIDAAHANGIFCGMCGEAAGEIGLTEILVGLGLDEFSMSASGILKIRKRISEIDYKKAQEKAKEILTLASAEEVLEKI